jgi:hypothetical protein
MTDDKRDEGGKVPYVARMKGEVLRGDDPGAALVVNEQVSPLDGLRALVTEVYGGEWDRSNPVLAEASSQVKVQVWRSCTRAWRENEGVDDEWSNNWWAPHGDGARHVLVVYYPGDVYDLGKRAEATAKGRPPSQAPR